MPKLLVEFLQEQQEPFTLEDYLLERGCSKGTTGLNYASSTFRRNSAQFLKKSASRLCVRKRRNFVPKCSEFVRAVCSRLIVLQHSPKIKNLENGGRRNSNTSTREIREEEHADEDKIFSSSASGTNVFDSCSESDVGEEDAHCSQVEADAERKLKWRSIEDCNKKLSPVSILEETEPDEEDSPFHDKGECSTSVSQCKSKQPTHYYSVKELEEFVAGSNSYRQFIINKRALQKKKQLLIDCVREVIENHRKRDDERKQRQMKNIFGAEELWKLVCENVWIWSQDSIDETNIVHLLRCDLMASLQEWSAHSEQHKEEVSIDIGDAILESMINEIITS